MYKLLLVTDREEVIEVFSRVHNLGDLQFAPITVLRDPLEGIRYLESNAVDAVSYSIRFSDVAPLHQYLVESRPSLPVFQVHHHDDTLLNELHRVRRFLDNLHSDHSDSQYDEAEVLAYLRDELMHQMLAQEVPTWEELKSRMKLVRAQAATDKPALLFDFDMPQGEVYLGNRWHYGRERLEAALANHFFGRAAEGLLYGVAVITPRHVRVIAMQPQGGDPFTQEELMTRAEGYVQKVVTNIKQYLDLDLDLQHYSILESVFDLTGQTPLTADNETA